MHLQFLLSSVARNEIVLTAELHLFKLRARVPEGALLQRQHFCQVSLPKHSLCLCSEALWLLPFLAKQERRRGPDHRLSSQDLVHVPPWSLELQEVGRNIPNWLPLSLLPHI